MFTLDLFTCFTAFSPSTVGEKAKKNYISPCPILQINYETESLEAYLVLKIFSFTLGLLMILTYFNVFYFFRFHPIWATQKRNNFLIVCYNIS